MFAKVVSVAVVGMEARAVEIDVYIGGGLPDFLWWGSQTLRS